MRQGKDISPDLLVQLKLLYDQGFGERRIAEKLNIGRSLVQSCYRILGLSGFGRRKKIQPRTPEQKQCPVCLEVKPRDQFRSHKTRGREYYENKCISCEKEYSRAINDTMEAKLTRREYRINNREEINRQEKVKRDTDPAYRLRKQVSTSIFRELEKRGGSKSGRSIMDFLPYTIQDLKYHLESQFALWMTWDNHGKYDPDIWDDNDPDTWTWQLDHIIPQSQLPYISMSDTNFQKCWSLNNLRPLSSKQNAIEGGRKTRHN